MPDNKETASGNTILKDGIIVLHGHNITDYEEIYGHDLDIYKKGIAYAVRSFINHGYRTFIVGYKTGFSIWAANAVLIYRKARPEYGIRLWMALPFEGFEQLLYGSSINVFHQADRVFYIQDKQFPVIPEIIDMADAICYVDIEPKENLTAYKERGKPILWMPALYVLALGRVLIPGWKPKGDKEVIDSVPP